MRTAIDSNILLDLLIPGAPNGSDSMALLQRAAAEGELLICEVVYAEVGSLHGRTLARTLLA